MKNSPLVSIGVPAYNQEKFIGECLDSLLGQTYQNLEIIVVDDASLDNTYDIAKAYKEKYPDKIKLFRNEQNKGVTATLLRIYDEITGEYFCSFAGDDIMMPEKVALQLKALESAPEAVMCMTNGYWFHSDTGKILKQYSPTLTPPSYAEMLKRQAVFAPATMIKSSTLPSNEIVKNFLESEWVVFTEVLSKGSCVYLGQPLIRYRRHSGSLSETVFQDKNLVSIDNAHKILQHFKNNLPYHRNINLGFAKTHKRYAKYFLQIEKDYKKYFSHYMRSLAYKATYIKSVIKEKLISS